jgi:hypothetical protein
MVAKLVVCAAVLLAFSAEAHALCRDDIKDVQATMEHMKYSAPQRYQLALAWWGKAQEAEPGSETECLNFLAQARKALFGPLPVLANCDATNTSLPECQNVQGNYGVVQPTGAVQALGGGGGGAALGGGGANTPFTPPGSPTQPGPTEATGTDRTD